MLKRLRVKDFTLFPEADFEFAPGLNVVIGEIGTGKSHLLKLAYSVMAALAGSTRKERDTRPDAPTKAHLQSVIADRLRGVFRPDELGRLTRRQTGRSRCEVRAEFNHRGLGTGFSFNSSSRSEVTIDQLPTAWLGPHPVFLPTRELLTIAPGFSSLYETTALPFEETWRDTCTLLEAPLARGPRLGSIAPLLAPLEAELGGKVDLEPGRGFYLKSQAGKLEMYLVAEGMRKLAMLARLIATGSLTDKGYLFWDEPEANMNPATLRKLARTILQLCRLGLQVFVATHSLFLMRELDILLNADEFKAVPARYLGLRPGESGVTVDQGHTFTDVGPITALNAELEQSDRYMESEAGAAL